MYSTMYAVQCSAQSVCTSAHFIELKLVQMGFGLVEMMKNLIHLVLV